MSMSVAETVRENYSADWRASDTLFERLAVLLAEWRPRSIVETGPGMSSILIYGYVKDHPGTKYASLDHEGPFHDKFVAHARELGYDTSTAFAVPLAADEYYAHSPLPPGPYDLVLLDGPASSESRALRRALDMIRPWVHPRSVVIQDDTHRGPERYAVDVIESWFPAGHFHREDIQDPNYPRLSTLLTPRTSAWKAMKRRLRRCHLSP